jgi:hypothetical protein
MRQLREAASGGKIPPSSIRRLRIPASRPPDSIHVVRRPWPTPQMAHPVNRAVPVSFVVATLRPTVRDSELLTHSAPMTSRNPLCAPVYEEGPSRGASRTPLELPPPHGFTVDAERSPLPAFRVFPFPPNDLRQATAAGPDLRFDGEFSVTARDRAGSRTVSEISARNSQTLGLTTPTELTAQPLSAGRERQVRIRIGDS